MCIFFIRKLIAVKVSDNDWAMEACIDERDAFWYNVVSVYEI